MAFLYKQPKSPFWWIRFRDASGKIKRESTGFRIGLGAATSKARQLCARKTMLEAQNHPGQNVSVFSQWVHGFISETYAKQDNTRTKYLSCWNALSAFFETKGIDRPSQVQREHALEYLTWRQNPTVKGIRNVSRNSALLDLRILRLVMFEAMNRDYIVKNPISKLGLKADDPKEKPEMSDEDINRIRTLLKGKPVWMQIAFEIAIHQGCRLSETCFPLKDVNLKRNEVTLTIKGNRRHTTALHPGLIPLLQKLIADNQEYTYIRPPNAGREWSRFFRKKRHNLGDLTFHSTRVTVISRMARSDVVEQKAMRFVGHANYEVHRIYQRVKVSDIAGCANALNIPKPSENPDSDSAK